MIQPGYAALGSGGSYGSGNGSHDGSVNEGNIAHHANGMSHESMGQMQQPEYTLAGILHFLQSEWRRYERDRNEWEIERAEMRARVALLEGERRSIENLKTDLMRRVKMLEFALRQERSKYISGESTAKAIPPKHSALQSLEKAASSSGRSSPAHEPPNEQTLPRQISTINSNSNTFSTLNSTSLNGLTMGGPGSTLPMSGAMLSRQTSNAKDPKARAKSREYLKQCLQEISYLTSASTLNPLPERPSGSNLYGPPRPRKSLSESVPATHQANENSGAILGAAARKTRSLDKGTYKTGPRGMQLYGEPLVESEDESSNSEQPGFHPDTETRNEGSFNSVEGLALDKASLIEDHRERDEPTEGNVSLHSQVVRDSTEQPLRHVADNQEPDSAILRQTETETSDWDKLEEADYMHRETGREKDEASSHLEDDRAQLQATSDRVQQLMRQSSSRKDDDELANLTLSSDTDEGASRIADEAAAESQMWKSKRVLRGHLDSVRSVAFDSANLSLYSASDDNTIKFWRIDENAIKSSRGTQSLNDVDPVMTLRGHSGAVTSLALSSGKRRLYSGSVDSSIVVWKLLDCGQVEPYPPYDKHLELARLVGHTQAIWDLCLLPSKNDEEGLLASASADGTVKIWDTEDTPDHVGGKLRLSFDYFGLEPSASKEKEKEDLLQSNQSLPIPTSVSTCMSDLRRCAVSFSNAVVKLFEVQTGREVMQFDSNQHYDGTEATQINKVITHPTLPVLMTAHENNYIQFYDINSGLCTMSMIGHLDSVTSLDIDPSGLTLVSGGHDCSVRFWDIVNTTSDAARISAEGNDKERTPLQEGDAGAAVCIQEITAHRKKSGEGVLFVKYHPSAPWFCSTGADGVIRIYG